MQVKQLATWSGEGDAAGDKGPRAGDMLCLCGRLDGGDAMLCSSGGRRSGVYVRVSKTRRAQPHYDMISPRLPALPLPASLRRSHALLSRTTTSLSALSPPPPPPPSPSYLAFP